MYFVNRIATYVVLASVCIFLKPVCSRLLSMKLKSITVLSIKMSSSIYSTMGNTLPSVSYVLRIFIFKQTMFFLYSFFKKSHLIIHQSLWKRISYFTQWKSDNEIQVVGLFFVIVGKNAYYLLK